MIRRVIRSSEGVTAIEFALVLPVLLLLIFGIIEFSLIMFASAAIESSTSLSARTGKTGFDPGQVDEDGQPVERKQFIRNEIRRRLGGMVNLDDVQILTRVYPGLENLDSQPGDPEGDVGRGGEVVEYTVIYNWPVITPFLDRLIGEEGFYEIVATTLVKNEPF